MNTAIPRENLAQLARSQYALAQQHCVQCRTYHAIWPCLRIAGAVGGVEADEPFLQPILKELLQAGRSEVLLAGSADSGVTAMVHRAMNPLSHHVRLTVLDRCMTPLMACQSYALTHGLDLSIFQADLLNVELPSKYDLIVGHSVLPFIPTDDRRALLATLTNNLKPNGRVVLTVRISTEKSGGAEGVRSSLHSADEMAEFVLNELKSQEMCLPDSHSKVYGMVHDYFRHRKLHICRFTSRETLIEDLNAVGLHVTSLLPLGYGNGYNTEGQLSAGLIKGWAYVVQQK